MKPNKYLLLLTAWTFAVGLTAARFSVIYRSHPQIAAVAYVEPAVLIADDGYLNTVAPWSQVTDVVVVNQWTSPTTTTIANISPLNQSAKTATTITGNFITGMPTVVTLDKKHPSAH